MKDLVLITSVINPPKRPLSYSQIRSVFTREERYAQTKKTIESIKQFLPNSDIMIVECSAFPEENREELSYFQNNCNYFLNLYNNPALHPLIFGASKALGEGTMTIAALSCILELETPYRNIIKISGRYWLTPDFDTSILDHNTIVARLIHGDIDNVMTLFYVLPYGRAQDFLKFLIDRQMDMVKCIGYEVLFAQFIKPHKVTVIKQIGVCGYVTVCGTFGQW